MASTVLNHHPDRHTLANELHARPFEVMASPSRVAFLAFKNPDRAAERSPSEDLVHLRKLVELLGGPAPADDARHYSAHLGRVRLKWERHTEFCSYMFCEEGAPGRPFDGSAPALPPKEWLDAAPGTVISAIQVHVQKADTAEAAENALVSDLTKHFVGESLAVASVTDGEALIAGDFRIQEDGYTRFAVITLPQIGPRRLGRIVQRMLEIETYRVMAMLALPMVRAMTHRMTEIDRELTGLIERLTGAQTATERETLAEVTRLSAEVESLTSQSAYRFGAARAYAAILDARINVLREERVRGWQLFSEFMSRRFGPAMRTCHSTEQRLADLSARAARAANLLRTRVDVEVAAQNQQLLESMDKRAATQLRLQETVEGLSIVAISYYAVNLAAYMAAPFAEPFGIDPKWTTAVLALPVIGLVWMFVRRVKRRLNLNE